MGFFSIADEVAKLAILVSLWGSLAMALLLLALVMRRRGGEQNRASIEINNRLLTREIMAALSSTGAPGEAYLNASAEQRLTAVSHLNRLVRGEDRVRLMAFVERHGLVERVLAKVRKRRTARRVEAVRTLGGVGGPQAVAALDDMLRHDPRLSVRLEAASMLARLEALPPASELLDALSLEDVAITPLHHALFRALAPHRVGELLALAKRQPPATLRALIVDAMGWSEDYSTLDAIAEAARDTEPEVRLAALAAATRLNHPAAAKWVEPLLSDPEPEVRAQAASACAAMGLRSALPALRRMLQDPSRWARLRARGALAVLSDNT